MIAGQGCIGHDCGAGMHWNTLLQPQERHGVCRWLMGAFQSLLPETAILDPPSCDSHLGHLWWGARGIVCRKAFAEKNWPSGLPVAKLCVICWLGRDFTNAGTGMHVQDKIRIFPQLASTMPAVVTTFGVQEIRISALAMVVQLVSRVEIQQYASGQCCNGACCLQPW